MKHTFPKNTFFSELFLGSDQMHLILPRHRTKTTLPQKKKTTLPWDRPDNTASWDSSCNEQFHALLVSSFCALVANALFYSSMDVPNSIARYLKTGTWIDWVYGRSKGIVCVHGKRCVYGYFGHYFQISWSEVDEPRLRHNWYIMGETKSNRNSPL